jgi:uncharacterized membrane protein
MKLLGHPVHQMLIVFPVGLLVTAFIFDLIGLLTGGPVWWQIAYWLIPAGVIGGLTAAIFGFLDWRGIPSGTRASRVGLWHGLGNVVVVVFFALSWWSRGEPLRHPETAALLLSLLGTALLFVTGWLGGELFVRLGVGVDEGANPNAPSSLQRIPPVRSRLPSGVKQASAEPGF